MNKRIISAVIGMSLTLSAFGGLAMTTAKAEVTDDRRFMEELNRGLIAVVTTASTENGTANGVYLSWRLLGTESLENQAFDIYKNGTYIKTTGAHDATCYFDASGKSTDKYKVVKKGTPKAQVDEEKAVTPTTNFGTARNDYVRNGTSEKNAFTWIDIPISRPDPVNRMGDGKKSYYYSYDSKEGGANDASVGDLDGDGEYEIVLKWDPTDSKDSAGADFTGNVYIDAYEIDPNNNGYKWRIDLGRNVTAGAHYTQYMVYDFDGDGRAEIAMQTAPGTIDGQGHYVSDAGNTDKIRNVDNTKSYVGTSGGAKGKNLGPEYYTIFDGETGAALSTVEAIPLGTSGEWGDSKYNRAERFLAGVAYIDGVHPSYIISRGYYNKVIMRAYTWDGNEFKKIREWDGSRSGTKSLYGQGCHSLSVADVDNDGKDEIIFGSAIADDDGSVYEHPKYGHGDALHASDYDNDGTQEIFQVHEAGKSNKGTIPYAADIRRYNSDTKKIDEIMLQGMVGDVGRGVMDNIDDSYAKSHSDSLALFWSSNNPDTYNIAGNSVNVKPNAGSRSMTNFLVYWDGDLGRELLDDTIIGKYYADTGQMKRFYNGKEGYSLAGTSSNNFTKQNPSLVADIWGDWREEIIMPVNKSSATEQAYLRIYTSVLPTEYRLTTLMHDSQYRCAVAWQNVGYNQPPHTSYYIGSAALANGANYLVPATEYTNVKYPSEDWIGVDGISLSKNNLRIERAKTDVIDAIVTPEEATKKSVKWTSSDETVATVSNGTVRGVSKGKATITATTNDGGYTAECDVEVWSTDVESIEISDSLINMSVGDSQRISATVSPADASEKTVKWTSSNESVASVSEDGTITGVSIGLATIYAETVDGGFEAACVANILPRGLEDMTGTNSFVTTSVEDETTKFTLTPTSGIISHMGDGAASGAEVHKDFEQPDSGKVALTFHFTTGGIANINGTNEDGSNNWNWEGHEYNTALSMLDTNGNNILTAEQVWETSATDLWSTIGNQETTSLIPDNAETADWMTVIDGPGQVKGSSKRWIVTAEFDYDTDTCTVDLIGTDSSWEAKKAEYTTTFNLNGAKFKTLKCYTTNTGSGTIIAEPKIEAVSYGKPVPVVGATEEIYVKGEKNGVSWITDDINDWTATGQTLDIDKANGRMYFHPSKPGSAYSATKIFEDISDNATLTYNIDWYFGGATHRSVNREYIQIGSDLRLAWLSDKDGKSGYGVMLSKDGGKTYDGYDNTANTMDNTKMIMSGSNAMYTKNIQVVIDTASKTITSFKFDGKEIELGQSLTMSSINSVTFGFERGGSTETWEYQNGIDNITVSQFVKNAVPKFNIRFVDDEGKTLKSVLTEVGAVPSYGEDTPPDKQDIKYVYTFAGWEPEPVPVVDEAVYTAKYTKAPRTYKLTLNCNGGQLDGEITSYTYGTSVILPIPSRDGYKFGGWYSRENLTGSTTSQLSDTATGDRTYYAKWTVIPKIELENVTDKSAEVSVVMAEPSDKLQLIGALYDGDDMVKEVKTEVVSDIQANTQQLKSLLFNNDINDYKLKIFVWNSIDSMIPLLEVPIVREKTN